MYGKSCLFCLSVAACLFVLLPSGHGRAQDGETEGASEEAVFIGSAACGECHPDQYESFSKYSKKAHSSQSVKIMASDLTPEELKECFHCHTTGYGKPGGFVGFTETPEMADAGCEVCHGPGSSHAEADGDPELIKGELSMDDCTGCHNEERVQSFNFKPMLFAGAH